MVEGPTNPQLLRDKTPATILYCLDALKRFEGMDDGQVLQVMSEIALLGRFGLDYASSERQYTLKSLLGDKFSGLHLLCLMYVSFQRVDSSMDPELPLHDAIRWLWRFTGVAKTIREIAGHLGTDRAALALCCLVPGQKPGDRAEDDHARPSLQNRTSPGIIKPSELCNLVIPDTWDALGALGAPCSRNVCKSPSSAGWALSFTQSGPRSPVSGSGDPICVQ